MVNFTNKARRYKFQDTPTRLPLVAKWDATLGMTIGLMVNPRKLFAPGPQHRMDMENVILIAAERGGRYAR